MLYKLRGKGSLLIKSISKCFSFQYAKTKYVFSLSELIHIELFLRWTSSPKIKEEKVIEEVKGIVNHFDLDPSLDSFRKGKVETFEVNSRRVFGEKVAVQR